MKRDMELVRKLLLYFEDKPDDHAVDKVDIQGYDASAISYHLTLLYEASFIEGEAYVSKTSKRIIDVLPFRLTWEGHEFLAAARNEAVWQTTTEKVFTKVGEVPFALLKTLLMQVLRAHLGDGTEGLESARKSEERRS